MTTDTPENISSAPETDLDWENRRLCSDDSCIGVIGADGRCRVCGLPDTETPADSDRSSDGSTVQEETQEEEEAAASLSENQAPESGDPGWEDRKLCRDESCIGTIGSDGRCTVCGLTG
ncbi:MAG: hypothetical protein Q7U40_02055 [Desulfatirhabdiaceae bacterium]|nr:hypothetical protein [Desulfatirhabdiaceae bacterium]